MTVEAAIWRAGRLADLRRAAQARRSLAARDELHANNLETAENVHPNRPKGLRRSARRDRRSAHQLQVEAIALGGWA